MPIDIKALWDSLPAKQTNLSTIYDRGIHDHKDKCLQCTSYEQQGALGYCILLARVLDKTDACGGRCLGFYTVK